MKEASREIFDNIPLRRWLLTVSPLRRKILLTKFRTDLVRLGLSKIAWRKGLLQLSSRPFVRLLREPETQAMQENHRHRLKLKKQEKRAHMDKNNNNDSMNRDIRPMPSTSSVQKERAYHSRDISKVDMNGFEKRSISESEYSRKHKKRINEKSKESYDRHSSERLIRRRRKKEKRRKAKEGENPNNIIWRLIPIDMDHTVESPDPRLRRRKWDKVEARFLQIFGEDSESPDTYFTPLNSGRNKKIESQESPETVHRELPVFSNQSRKKRKTEAHGSGSGEGLQTSNSGSRKNSTSSENTSSKQGKFSALTQEELINTLQDDSAAATSPASIAKQCVRDRDIVNPHHPETQGFSTSCNTTTEPTESNTETQTGRFIPDLESMSDDDDRRSVVSNASQSSVATITLRREKSVITRFHTELDESVRASLNEADQELSGLSEFIVNENLPIRSSPKRPTPLPCETVEKEPIEECCRSFASPQSPVESAASSPPDQKPLSMRSNDLRDSLDNDPKPSSTTDMESPMILESGISCAKDRLLGALDNIFLALHYRRIVREREMTASKLAIKKNRQDEIMKAKQELESKLGILREEIQYLYTRLDTWDRVLRFISRGLDHRTPNDMQPFDVADIKSAMLEAELKIPISLSDEESSTAVSESCSIPRVLCTIDLTEDNGDDEDNDESKDLCDSSTDPLPRSHAYGNVIKKFQPDIEDDCSSKQDLNANNIENDSPSIIEVKTISPQQYENIDDGVQSSSPYEDDHPCLLCSRKSIVACGVCAKALYCSKVCQIIHWDQSHHASCVPMNGIICLEI